MPKIKLFLPLSIVAFSLSACNPNAYRDIDYETALEMRNDIVNHALASNVPNKFYCEKITNYVDAEQSTTSVKEHVNFDHASLYYAWDETDTTSGEAKTKRTYFYYHNQDNKFYKLIEENKIKHKELIAEGRIKAEEELFKQIRDPLFDYVYGNGKILMQFEAWINEHEANVAKIKSLGDQTKYYDELKFSAISSGNLKYNWKYYLPPKDGVEERLDEETVWSNFVIVNSRSSQTFVEDLTSRSTNVQYGTKIDECTIEEINLADWPDVI